MDIYGKEESVLKSRMKRVKPNRHSKEHKVPLPTKVIENHGEIILYVDIFFMKKIQFYLSKSGDVIFLLVTKLLSRSGNVVLK